jgi:hypothetical protein
MGLSEKVRIERTQKLLLNYMKIYMVYQIRLKRRGILQEKKNIIRENSGKKQELL